MQHWARVFCVYSNAYAYADTDTDSNADDNEYADEDEDAHGDANRDSNLYPNTNRHAKVLPDEHRDANPYADTHEDAHTNSYADRYPNGDSRNSYCYPCADSHPHADPWILSSGGPLTDRQCDVEEHHLPDSSLCWRYSAR